MNVKSFTVARLLAISVLLLLAFAVRTRGVTQDFWLMGDQIRDWDLVQGPFETLPTTGTPRSGGGHHLGPAYYWFLWSSRVVLSPWLGNLPHVGGITVTAVELASFGALAVAAMRLGLPFPAVLGMTALLASNPYAAALARAGWNPSLALAFGNFALALFILRRERWAARDQLMLTSLCLIGMQMHVAAFPLALCLIGLGACAHRKPGASRVKIRLGATALAIGVLQLPFTIAQWHETSAGTPDSIDSSVARLVDDPGIAFDARGIAFVMGDGARQLFLGSPLSLSGATMLFGLLAVVGAWAVLVRRGDSILGIAVYLPLGLAAVGFTILDRVLEAYWLLPLLGLYGLIAILPALLAPEGAGHWASVVLLSATIALLPGRRTWFSLDHRYGYYGVMTRAAASLAAGRVSVRALVGPMDRVRETSSSALVRWLGGTLASDSALVARVSPAGQLSVQAELVTPTD